MSKKKLPLGQLYVFHGFDVTVELGCCRYSVTICHPSSTKHDFSTSHVFESIQFAKRWVEAVHAGFIDVVYHDDMGCYSGTPDVSWFAGKEAPG